MLLSWSNVLYLDNRFTSIDSFTLFKLNLKDDDIIYFNVVIKLFGRNGIVDVYTLEKPPIFNRLFIKLDNGETIVLFPEPCDCLLETQVKTEMVKYPNLKHGFIDTMKYHTMSHGGNLHCLFKQIFKIPALAPALAPASIPTSANGGSRSRKKLKTKSKKKTKYRRYRNSRKKQLGKRKSKTTSKNRKSRKSRI